MNSAANQYPLLDNTSFILIILFLLVGSIVSNFTSLKNNYLSWGVGLVGLAILITTATYLGKYNSEIDDFINKNPDNPTLQNLKNLRKDLNSMYGGLIVVSLIVIGITGWCNRSCFTGKKK